MSIPWKIEGTTSRHRPAILRQRNTPIIPALAERNTQKLCSRKVHSNENLTEPNSNKENAIADTGRKIAKVRRKENLPLKNVVVNHQVTQKVPEFLDPLNSVLPEEIRHFIFDKLSFKELLVCRTVSKAWRMSVESFKKFHVTIDDSGDFSGTCNIRMNSCVIQTLIAAQNRRLFQAATPESVEIVKRISQWNVGEMAEKWSDLTNLKIGWKALISFFMFRHCVKYPTKGLTDIAAVPVNRAISGFLPHLQHIHLEVPTAVEGEIFNVLNQNLGYILQWQYPSLTHLTINFLDNSVRQDLLSKVSSFVRFHSVTLRRVNVQFSNLNRRIPRCIPQRSLLFDTEMWNWRNRSQLCKGQVIKLSEYSLEFPYTNSEMEEEDESRKWQQILRQERDLELLIISKLQLNIRRAEYFYFFIKMYSQQLTVIELINLSVYDIEKNDKMTPIDMTLFSECINLKKLGLWRAPILLNEVLPEASSEIVNLSGLPRSVSSLTIDGLPVQSDDIVTTIHNLKYLTKFSYARAAMPRRNHLPQSGVTLEVLTALITHSRLTEMDVMTASSVPRGFYSDNENGFTTLASANKWNIKEVRQLWYNCIKILMLRSFKVRRIP